MPPPLPRKRIVIVGAGFGGMAAVKALKGADADITLVDRTNHHLFQPLLYQVATAALSPADIPTATRERLLSAFEWAEECGDPDMIRRLLTFVVVGGGPTGVEMAGTIAELARSTLAWDFKNIDPRSARIILCEAGDRVLSAFPQKLSDYAAGALKKLGVEVHLNEAVNEIDATGLLLGETRVETENIIWCAGTEARPAADWIGADAARNRGVKTEPNCSVPGRPEIFATGEVSGFDAGLGTPLPGLAPVAKQQGAYVGRLLKIRIAGRPEPGPFRYRDLG